MTLRPTRRRPTVMLVQPAHDDRDMYTEFLRLTLRTSIELGVDPASLVHALQNHDELTYELVHWSSGHRDDVYTYRGEEITGEQLGESVRQDLLNQLTGPKAPYNQVFTTNGIASTSATVVAAALGISDLDEIDDIDPIRRAHLLLAMFNALQPGVFALSGWDMCGMLTLPENEVAELLRGGDTRWIHRAGHDLMGVNERATRSMAGMPRCRSLYGSIPEQLADETSFLRQLQAILRVRSHYGVATSRQVDIPEVKGMSTRRAAQKLAGAGFYVSIGDRQPSSERDGTVAETSPHACASPAPPAVSPGFRESIRTSARARARASPAGTGVSLIARCRARRAAGLV